MDKISELNLENSVKIIQENKINILIDLMGFTGPNKIELFQIEWQYKCCGLDIITLLDLKIQII